MDCELGVTNVPTIFRWNLKSVMIDDEADWEPRTPDFQFLVRKHHEHDSWLVLSSPFLRRGSFRGHRLCGCSPSSPRTILFSFYNELWTLPPLLR